MNEHNYKVDHQGFLEDRLSWRNEFATYCALQDNTVLTEEHWEIIHYYRSYYENYNIPPPMRMVIRLFRNTFGEQNANSRYLHQLFVPTINKTISRYAGLPKPKNCK